MAAEGALRPPPGPAPVDAALCNLVYRSRAVAPLGPAELGGLVAAAQARNRAESVTGVVVYDDGRFLQWLEGPAEGVGRVAASVSADARHADVEILHEEPAHGGRRFGGWDMRLAARPGAADGGAGEG
ncbi:BLUF domain-containing protein, partial [Craurococcus roseus]|uniref:BLUF domain-containing protein n=1 Tax=Craurococcus roseus TaxID=77585 RepID=UPI0031DF4523